MRFIKTAEKVINGMPALHTHTRPAFQDIFYISPVGDHHFKQGYEHIAFLFAGREECNCLLLIQNGIHEKMDSISVVSTVRITVCAMWRRIGPSLDCQEVLIQIGLMCQVQTFLADIEHLVLGTVDSS
jgi:hypothetical protein